MMVCVGLQLHMVEPCLQSTNFVKLSIALSGGPFASFAAGYQQRLSMSVLCASSKLLYCVRGYVDHYIDKISVRCFVSRLPQL